MYQTQALLGPDEPAAFELFNPDGQGGVVLVCDHASNRVPASLGNLGLTEEQLESHIAWDPGAAGIARELSIRIDAPLLLTNYSRLVIDCNRWPSDSESIPVASADITVPGNIGLSESAVACRRKALFEPYHAAIAGLLTRPLSLPRFLLSIHSFTPSLAGVYRPWSIGVCYRLDVKLAQRWLDILKPRLSSQSAGDAQNRGEELLGDNEPYKVEVGCDYTIPVQGESRGIPSIMLELRQDKIRDDVGARGWSDLIADSWLSLLRQ